MKLRIVNLFSNAVNLIKQIPTDNKKDYYDDIIVWGTDKLVYLDSTHKRHRNRDHYYINHNDFPQQLIQNIYNSPVASSCADVWVEYLCGDGFKNPDLNNIQINEEGDTLLQLFHSLSFDVAYMDGLSVHINYNLKGAKKSYNHQPFEQTRLGVIDKIKADNRNKIPVTNIKTNPYFGIPDEYESKYTKTFYTYNPESVSDQIKKHKEEKLRGKVKYDYPGQMYWQSIEKPLARIYPQPFFYSGESWFKIDAEIQRFHERNIKNNLFTGCIINMHGDPDQAVSENSDLTIGERFDELLQENASGSKNAGNTMVNFYMNEEEKAEILPFPTNANDKMFETLQRLTTDNITIAWKVPPILIGIQQAGKLGNTNDVLNAVKTMQSTVRRKQEFLSKNIYELFHDFEPVLSKGYTREDFDIKSTNPIDLVPEWVFDQDILEKEEKRNYINENFKIKIQDFVQGQSQDGQSQDGEDNSDSSDSHTIVSEGNEILRNLTGRQRQQIFRDIEKYENGKITRAQIGVLLRGFGLSEDEIKEMLGENEEEENMPINISSLNQESFNDYPKSATENACKVLRWIEEHGRDEVEGMTSTGLARANQLCKKENISLETIKRMAAFERHRENSEISEEFKGTPWKDRGYVAWLGWGGDEGIAWAKRKIEQIEKTDARKKT